MSPFRGQLGHAAACLFPICGTDYQSTRMRGELKFVVEMLTKFVLSIKQDWHNPVRGIRPLID